MTPRDPQTGSALLVTMILVIALLAGGAVLTNMQLSESRTSSMTRAKSSALYCAEAGLAAARASVAANYASWSSALGQSEPSWLAGIDHDLDDDGIADFTVTLRDNDDEPPPLANDLTRDNDLMVFVVSTCTKYPEVKVQVAELVRYNGGGNCYQAQQGGCGGNNNQN